MFRRIGSLDGVAPQFLELVTVLGTADFSQREWWSIKMRLGHAKQAHFFRPVKRGRGVPISCPIWTRGLPTMIVCGRWGSNGLLCCFGPRAAQPPPEQSATAVVGIYP
jgi:hypothetical protein